MPDQIGRERRSPKKFVPSLERNLGHSFTLVDFVLPHLKHSHGPIVNHFQEDRTGQHVEMRGVQRNNPRPDPCMGGRTASLRHPAQRCGAPVVISSLCRRSLNPFVDPKAQRKKVIARIPMRNRVTLPDEIAATVIFFISSRAAHTTGQHVFVDGGYVHLDQALT
jgi:L-fucose dehydrogenase